MSSSLGNYLKELSDVAKPVVASKLVKLSDLSREEKDIFRKEWPAVGVARRREVIDLLVEISEDNLELDFDEVYRICLSDADTEVRVKAVMGLSLSEERSLIDPMIGLLLGDAEQSVRAAAAVPLGTFALLAEFGELSLKDAEKVEKALLTAFNKKDEQTEVRCRALEAISPLNNLHVEEIIRQAYQSNDLEFRASAVYAMGQSCNRNWLPILLKELRSPQAELRFEAAGACGELGAEEAVPRLVELTRDSDFEVQLSAIAALGKIGGSRAKEVLNECLGSDDESISEAAQEALEELKFWEDPLAL